MWFDANHCVGLGHTRLSIIDLTDAGSQPMISHTGRFVISYNGEIYNTSYIKKIVHDITSDIKYEGHSDTEILLTCIEVIGLKKTLINVVGMFAFVLWDRQEKSLYLVRDCIGEKPLYYGFQKMFIFGSELKTLKQNPFIERILT